MPPTKAKAKPKHAAVAKKKHAPAKSDEKKKPQKAEKKKSPSPHRKLAPRIVVPPQANKAASSANAVTPVPPAGDEPKSKTGTGIPELDAIVKEVTEDVKKTIRDRKAKSLKTSATTDLKTKVAQLEHTLDMERKDRVSNQVERDQLSVLYDSARKRLESLESEVWVKEREIENVKLQSVEDVKFVGQKVKFLLREHQTQLAKVNEEASVSLLSNSERVEVAAETDEKIDTTMSCTIEDQLRKDFEEKLDAESVSHRVELRNLREELAAKARKDQKEWEAKRKWQIEELTSAHENQMTRMSEALKGELAEARDAAKKAKDELLLLRHSFDDLNERLRAEVTRSAELERVLSDLSQMKHQTACAAKQAQNQQTEYKALRAEVISLRKRIEEIDLEKEIEIQQKTKLLKERSDIYFWMVDIFQDLETRFENAEMRRLLIDNAMQQLRERLLEG